MATAIIPSPRTPIVISRPRVSHLLADSGQTWHVPRSWNEESLPGQLNRTRDHTANMHGDLEADCEVAQALAGRSSALAYHALGLVGGMRPKASLPTSVTSEHETGPVSGETGPVWARSGAGSKLLPLGYEVNGTRPMSLIGFCGVPPDQGRPSIASHPV